MGLVAPAVARSSSLKQRERAIQLPKGAPFHRAVLRVEYETWTIPLGPIGGPDLYARATLSLDDLPPLRIYEDYAKRSFDSVRGMLDGTWQLVPSADGRALAFSFDGQTWRAAYLDVELHGKRYPFVDPDTWPTAQIPSTRDAALALLDRAGSKRPPSVHGDTRTSDGEESYDDWSGVEGAMAYALGHGSDEPLFTALARCVAFAGQQYPERPLGELDAAAAAFVRTQLPQHPVARGKLEALYLEHTPLARHDSREEKFLGQLESLLGTLPPELQRPSIEGLVRGSGGGAPAGAVELWTRGPEVRRIAEATLDGGAFAFSGVPDGQYDLVPIVDGAAPERSWVSAPNHEVELRLRPGQELQVLVRNQGKPMAGAKVMVVNTAKASRPGVCVSSLEGSCTVRALVVEGAYQVEVEAPHRACVAKPAYPSKRAPVEIDVSKTASLEGHLTDWRKLGGAKPPIAGATLRAEPWGEIASDACTVREARTDASGHFRFEGLSPDTEYDLFLLVPGKEPRHMGVQRPGSLAELQLTNVP